MKKTSAKRSNRQLQFLGPCYSNNSNCNGNLNQLDESDKKQVNQEKLNQTSITGNNENIDHNAPCKIFEELDDVVDMVKRRKIIDSNECIKKKLCLKNSDVVLDMTHSEYVDYNNHETNTKIEPTLKNIEKAKHFPTINNDTQKYLRSIYSNKEPINIYDNSPDMFLQYEEVESESLRSNKVKDNACELFKHPQCVKDLKKINRKIVPENPNNANFDMSQLFKSTQIEKIMKEYHKENNCANIKMHAKENVKISNTPEGDMTQILKSSQVDRLLSNVNLYNTNNVGLTNGNSNSCTKEFTETGNNIYNNKEMCKTTLDPFDSSQIFKSTDLESILVDAEKICSMNPQTDNERVTQKEIKMDVHDKQAPALNIIELQKHMSEVNESNVNMIEAMENEELLNAVQSSQYKKNIEALFDICEMSICNISANVESNEQNNDQNETLGLAALQGINWENDSIIVKEFDNNLKSPKRNSVYDYLKQTLLSNAQKTVEPMKKTTKPAINEKSIFVSKGPYYGLPIKCQQLIQQYKNISKLYDWQDECLKLPAITQRKNLIYALPTSGGKTLVAEILILREILCHKKNVIFILPFVSIVQEKIWALSPFAVALEFLVEEYAGGKGQCPPRKRRHKHSVYIATIEKSLGLLNSLCEMGRMQEIGLVVVDELHLLGESGRGATLEIALTKILDSKEQIQIIGMSATIGNISEIAKFLSADVYTRDFRPVELKEYVKCGTDIMSVSNSNTQNLFTHVRTCEYYYTEMQSKMDPDHLGGLVLEILPQHSCLVFCASKKNCENVSSLICRIFPDSLLEHRKDEKIALCNMIKSDCGSLCSTLRYTLPYGVAYHHSGLTSDERKHLEDAYRAGVISVICCTSTLAAGVNLPAKRVILRSPYVGRDFITLSRYKQMIGRAGRAGFGETGESILIFSPKDTEQVRNLLCSPMDEALSSLHYYNNEGLKNLILSSVGLNMATNRIQLRALVNKTLMSVQAARLGINVKQITDSTISNLFKLGALTTKEEAKKITPTLMENSIAISQTQEQSQDVITNNAAPKKCVMVGRNTCLAISKLGKAAARACINLKRAHMLYNDLLQAQSNLVLLDCLHLLYLVTPYEQCDQIKPNMAVYYSVYTKLGLKELHTAKALGINEACAIKMLSGKEVKNVPTRVLNRFYVTLVLYDLWNHETVHDVSNKFQVPRGSVQTLMTSAAAFSSSVLRFCEELEEFWAFKDLLTNFTLRLQHCCTLELLPLMELPSVKIARAKQLYNAGYKTLHLIAKTTPSNLVRDIENLNQKVASQLISAAKLLLLEKVETLREEAEDVLEGLWLT